MDDDVASRAQDESLLERPSSTTPPFNLIPPSNDPSTTSSEETYSPDAVGVATGSQSPVKDMEPETSGHRRRRSSLLNNLDTNIQTKTKKSPVSGGSGHLSIPDGKARDGSSEDESRSTSDDVELEDLSDEDLHDDEETGLTKKDKKRKKRRRRRNTLLNQRVAAEVKLTEMEKRDALRNVVKRLLINGSLIALWYTFSLSISLYNKWMFDPKHLNFEFPLFTTSMHMLVQFGLASLVLYLFPRFRPRYDSISNPKDVHNDSDAEQHGLDSKKPLMSRFYYLTRIGPCGVATSLDIGLGNMSLQFISLTFYTMCKSSALGFVLLFAFVFRLETPSIRLVLIIFTMTVGVIMMVFGEIDFSVIGFILIMTAAFFSGFRWALTQILLLRNPATSNPFSSIFYLAPVMFISLFCIAVPVEGFPSLFQGLGVLVDKKGVLLGPLLLLFPGAIAFSMISAEFALLQRTSVVTLSIAGIFKEVITIAAAGRAFHETLTPINISGLIITIAAIAAYNYIKIRKMRDEAQKAATEKGKQYHLVDEDLLGGTGSDADGEDEDDDEREDGVAKGRAQTSHMAAGTAMTDAERVKLVAKKDVSD